MRAPVFLRHRVSELPIHDPTYLLSHDHTRYFYLDKQNPDASHIDLNRFRVRVNPTRSDIRRRITAHRPRRRPRARRSTTPHKAPHTRDRYHAHARRIALRSPHPLSHARHVRHVRFRVVRDDQGDRDAATRVSRVSRHERDSRRRRRERRRARRARGVDGAEIKPQHPEPDLRWVHGRVVAQGAGTPLDSGSRYARLGPRAMARVRAAFCIARARNDGVRARGRRIFTCSIADARDRGRARVAWVRSRADPHTRIGAYQRESISQSGLSRARVVLTVVLCAWFSVMYRWRSSTCSRGKRRRKPSLKCRWVFDAMRRARRERYTRARV